MDRACTGQGVCAYFILGGQGRAHDGGDTSAEIKGSERQCGFLEEDQSLKDTTAIAKTLSGESVWRVEGTVRRPGRLEQSEPGEGKGGP